jgi:hypothetical protein
VKVHPADQGVKCHRSGMAVELLLRGSMKSIRKFSTTNFTVPVSLLAGIGLGIAVFCAFRARRQRNTLSNRARRQIADISSTAADILEKGREQLDRQGKGLVNAVEAGKKAFQRSVA